MSVDKTKMEIYLKVKEEEMLVKDMLDSQATLHEKN